MKGLMAERMQGADELQAAKRLFDANTATKILVVGGRTTNLQRAAREHPRVVCWESTMLSKSGNAPTMPSTIGVVIMTRFVGHNVFNPIKQQAADRRAFMFGGLLQTGEVRHILTELLGLSYEPQTVAEAEDNEHATEQDIQETPMAWTEPAKARVEPITAVMTNTPTNEGQLDARLDEAVKLVHDTIKSLETAGMALALVHDELVRTKEVIRGHAEEFDTLRKFKTLLGGIK